MNSLEIQALSIGYGTPLIHDIHLSACEGQIICLLGPNGSGKSTLLRTLSRQLQPLGGTVLLEEKDFKTYTQEDFAKTVASVMTGYRQPQYMTAGELVALGRYAYTGKSGLLASADRQACRRAMHEMQIDALENCPVTNLSDGQRQRVYLAAALCQEPRILLLDEPTSYLDIHYKLEMLSLLRQLCRIRKMTVILSLHELELAQQCADILLCLQDGHVFAQGTPEKVLTPENLERLYGIAHHPLTGPLLLSRPKGRSRILVLSAGGTGIPVYRRLAREEIPFACGIFSRNDADYPMAKQLASEIIEEEPFSPLGERAIVRALSLVNEVETVIEAGLPVGTGNLRIREVLDTAKRAGKLVHA